MFDPDSRIPYGIGAVLMAGAEILRTLEADVRTEPAALIKQAESLVARTLGLSSICNSPCD